MLAACGSKGASNGASNPSKVLAPDQSQPVLFFKSGTPPAGIPFRLPFGLGSTEGVLEAGGPAQMQARILDANGAAAQAPVTVTRHAKQLQRPYWPVPINLAKGTYQAVFTIDGKDVGSPAFFEVGTATKLPKPGDKLPVHTTPTPASTEGVTPICTRSPACPLHDVSLDTVLGRKPVALLVATPAYCQTAICGPVLDVLLGNRLDGITYSHAEVWMDDTFKSNTPLLEAYGIEYEPVLFVVRADGTVVDRLDVIFDADDVTASLKRALS